MGYAPEILLSDSLGAETRNIIELSKPYNTIILIYGDEFSERLLASWAEQDRLNLPTRRIGQVYSGIEVHSFGLDSFTEGTVLELHIRETPRNPALQNAQRTVYKSLLNELCSISAQLRQKTATADFMDVLH
jgi:hypothetical protein